MDLLLLVVLAALLVFMFTSSRRRTKKMKEEQERRQAQMVPGARVMTRSGIFGTIVSFDADDLTQAAEIEVAPGVVIEVHAQALDLAPETSAVAADAADGEVADVEPATQQDELLNLSGADVERPVDDAPRVDGLDDIEGGRRPGDDKPQN
ncbi:preprotein translocase subunit YajC [Microbacterium oryzae]|uniref:preprotein translocase subunit YajC n=1 Tax=Microbacterium oryzae TaxID=743009 RepID=UPI0025B19643|nr:preprotein translocase subunit YajC [Microbacterium oryzae]MDN3310501.1 preprotein translocase subunit YajC [Microbacterium oryzae]